MGSQQKKPEAIMDTSEDSHSDQVMNFKVISEATNFFSESNKIGQGGYGTVYKVYEYPIISCTGSQSGFLVLLLT